MATEQREVPFCSVVLVIMYMHIDMADATSFFLLEVAYALAS